MVIDGHRHDVPPLRFGSHLASLAVPIPTAAVDKLFLALPFSIFHGTGRIVHVFAFDKGDGSHNLNPRRLAVST